MPLPTAAVGEWLSLTIPLPTLPMLERAGDPVLPVSALPPLGDEEPPMERRGISVHACDADPCDPDAPLAERCAPDKTPLGGDVSPPLLSELRAPLVNPLDLPPCDDALDKSSPTEKTSLISAAPPPSVAPVARAAVARTSPPPSVSKASSSSPSGAIPSVGAERTIENISEPKRDESPPFASAPSRHAPKPSKLSLPSLPEVAWRLSLLLRSDAEPVTDRDDTDGPSERAVADDPSGTAPRDIRSARAATHGAAEEPADEPLSMRLSVGRAVLTAPQSDSVAADRGGACAEMRGLSLKARGRTCGVRSG